MEWTMNRLITAQADEHNMRLRIMTGDGYAPHPFGLYFDGSVPADNDWGTLYISGYCGDVLTTVEVAELTDISGRCMLAIAESAGYPEFEGLTWIEIYIADGYSTPPWHERTACYSQDIGGYADLPMVETIPDSTERAKLIAYANTLRNYSLTALGLAQVTP